MYHIGMRIGQVAARAAVNIQTLRYYERRGLLPTPARRPSGYRNYQLDTVDRVHFIKHAQAVGFTLDEIGELLALRVGSERACAQVESRATAAVHRIDERIAHLRHVRDTLAQLIDACREQHLTGECPILHALGDAPTE